MARSERIIAMRHQLEFMLSLNDGWDRAGEQTRKIMAFRAMWRLWVKACLFAGCNHGPVIDPDALVQFEYDVA